MSRPKPQFRAHLTFTFEEHGIGRRHWFEFGEDGHRRVPMQMEGLEGLNTVGMWIEGSKRFKEGDEVTVDCCVIWVEGFRHVVKKGVQLKLWDGGFFANGEVIEEI